MILNNGSIKGRMKKWNFVPKVLKKQNNILAKQNKNSTLEKEKKHVWSV